MPDDAPVPTSPAVDPTVPVDPADRLALRALVEGYACACDERDAHALRCVFAEGATLTVHWPDRPAVRITFPDGADGVASSLGRYVSTRHFVGNHRVAVAGDTATGTTYCVAHHVTRTGTDAHDHVMHIRYQDTYARTGSGWRIASRDLHVDWTEDRVVTA